MDIRVLASGSSGNAYVISDGTTSLLLDAGIPIKAIKTGCRFRLHDIAACLITHEHKDHSKAAADLARRGVDVYASRGTIEACGLSGHRIRETKALKEEAVGTFMVLPFDVQHDAAEPLGFLCTSTVTREKLLYFTDTGYIKYRFTGLTHIMAECNHDEESIRASVDDGRIHTDLAKRIIRNHMSLERLIEMLKANDMSTVRQIHLLHLSSDNADTEKMVSEVRKATGVEVYAH